jgi:hypothetical protein
MGRGNEFVPQLIVSFEYRCGQPTTYIGMDGGPCKGHVRVDVYGDQDGNPYADVACDTCEFAPFLTYEEFRAK